MDDNKTVTIDYDIWERAQCELQQLKQQNQELVLKLKKLQTRSRGNSMHTRYSMALPTYQLAAIKEDLKNAEKDKFKTEMMQSQKILDKMSEKSNSRVKKILNQIPEEKVQKLDLEDESQSKQKIEITSELGNHKENTNIEIKQQLISESKQLNFIESICLFGPDQRAISENLTQRRMSVPHSLIYTVNKDEAEEFAMYGEYFYPEGKVPAKNLREEEALTQVNQIIFRKNAKREDCALFIFRPKENNPKLEIQNPIISQLNPGKWLYAFFVQFSDFSYIQNQHAPDPTSITTTTTSTSTATGTTTTTTTSPSPISNTIKSKYTLCIFTYFPIINSMQSILSTMMDEIKIKRVQKFAQNNQIKDVCIKFFIHQLNLVATQAYRLVRCFREQQADVDVCGVKISFSTSEQKLEQSVYAGWLYDILKIFDKDLIYDIYTSLMTEEPICFVCENIRMLTYVIFLFACVLPNPFVYPYYCVNTVSNFEFLESPFILIAGILQTSKWIDDNAAKYPNKIFVDLNDEPKIKGKKKPKPIKSQKLKKVLNILSKKIESTSPVPQIFKKKQTIIRAASREQNTIALSILKSLQAYYTEQIFSLLPNPAIIAHIRNTIQGENQSNKMASIEKQIEKYLRESRKGRERDQFVEFIVQQQVFYLYVRRFYGLW